MKIPKTTKVWKYTNLYGCKIGENCVIGSYVEIGKDVEIGNNCKIEAGAFLCTGVIIEDNVFIGPKVCFTNDKYPKVNGDWELKKTIVKKGAVIGANSTILCGIKIGSYSFIGAGSVVTKDVKNNTVVMGNPAKELKIKSKKKSRCYTCNKKMMLNPYSKMYYCEKCDRWEVNDNM